MNLREETEILEKRILSPLAAFSSKSAGRNHEEEKCRIRTDFQRDRDRIIYSKSFRRLKHKTQVFISPEGDHYRTRLTHTLEVSQIARTIARSLRLNEDLAEATALGHDLGHTPFGHAGEHVLNGICPWGFKHNEHGIRVVDQLEGDPDWGLNLTQEVKDGILNHVWAGKARTLEGRIVRIADRTAYINHDIEDAIRGRILSPEQLPKTAVKVLGITSRERINTMITDIIAASRDREDILMSSEIAGATDELHRFMFENVYIDSSAKTEENKAKKIVGELYRHFLENPADLPEYNRTLLDKLDTDRVICDYIAGMTDRFAIKEFERLYIPLNWGY